MEKELLNKFIETERMKFRGGSGDDEFYEKQVVDYINKQKPLWLEFIKFIEKELKGGKIMDKEILERKKELESLINSLIQLLNKDCLSRGGQAYLNGLRTAYDTLFPIQMEEDNGN